MNERFHHALNDIIGGVVILAGKILLQQVFHRIENAAGHLILGNAERVFGVEDGEARIDIGRKYPAAPK